MAMEVPIQKFVVGLFFRKKNAPIPTHTGERLVSRVAWVAVDCWMAIFQTATSKAKIKPHKTVKSNNFFDWTFSCPVKKAKGTKDRKSTRLNSSHVRIS